MDKNVDLNEMEESKKINEIVNLLCVSNVMYDNLVAGIEVTPENAASACAVEHKAYLEQLNEYMRTADISKLSKELYFVVSYLKYKKDHTEVLN